MAATCTRCGEPRDLHGRCRDATPAERAWAGVLARAEALKGAPPADPRFDAVLLEVERLIRTDAHIGVPDAFKALARLYPVVEARGLRPRRPNPDGSMPLRKKT